MPEDLLLPAPPWASQLPAYLGPHLTQHKGVPRAERTPGAKPGVSAHQGGWSRLSGPQPLVLGPSGLQEARLPELTSLPSPNSSCLLLPQTRALVLVVSQLTYLCWPPARH